MVGKRSSFWNQSSKMDAWLTATPRLVEICQEGEKMSDNWKHDGLQQELKHAYEEIARQRKRVKNLVEELDHYMSEAHHWKEMFDKERAKSKDLQVELAALEVMLSARKI